MFSELLTRLPANTLLLELTLSTNVRKLLCPCGQFLLPRRSIILIRKLSMICSKIPYSCLDSSNHCLREFQYVPFLCLRRSSFMMTFFFVVSMVVVIRVRF